MADLLSLFRGTKPGATTPKTTPTTPVAPEADKPVRSGTAPTISVGMTYDVVVPAPSPAIQMPAGLHAPGTTGDVVSDNGSPGADTTGWYFIDDLSPSASMPAPASPPATFFVLQATTAPKVTEDGLLADRLYRLFTKGRA